MPKPEFCPPLAFLERAVASVVSCPWSVAPIVHAVQLIEVVQVIKIVRLFFSFLTFLAFLAFPAGKLHALGPMPYHGRQTTDN
jgi:hypothetical protein